MEHRWAPRGSDRCTPDPGRRTACHRYRPTPWGARVYGRYRSEELKAYTNQQVYTTQHPLLVYGTAPENAPLVLRLFAPDGTIAEFEQIITNSDGSFSFKMLDWPDSSTQFPYGTYTVEALSSVSGESQKIDIKFAASTELEMIPIERRITTQVYELFPLDKAMLVSFCASSEGII